MSMMLPPDPGAAPNLPVQPGGGDNGGPPPLDALNQGPVPAGGGIGDLLSALGQGGPDEGPGASTAEQSMTSAEHIQEAMKHLMMALAKEPDESQGTGIVKGMGALQAILGGKQKAQQQQDQMAAAPGAGG